jgi:hypothetical protein
VEFYAVADGVHQKVSDQMISAIRLCPKCGSEIPVDAPEGGCPGCLLESGLRLLDEEAVGSAIEVGYSDEPTAVAEIGNHHGLH